jgi:monoamine oxidase
MKEDIIIVGAGVCGLMAARQLSSKGKSVLVLEADNRIGGRIYTVNDPAFPVPIELGAEFVHGKLPLTTSLLAEAGIPFEEDNVSMIKIAGGKWYRSDDVAEGWDEMLDKMESVKIDMSLRSFLDLYYKHERFEGLRKEVVRFAEGFDLADVNLVSIQYLVKEWKHETGKQYRIPGGYKKLVDYLAEECKANGCKIVTGAKVDTIDWKKNKVCVTSKSGRIYEASKAIVTVPIGVIQSVNTHRQSIEFNPSIAVLLKNAAYVGFGSVIKYFGLFDNFFSSVLNQSAMLISDQKIPTWWVRFYGKQVLLTGWMGGPSATRNARKSQPEYRAQMLESLAGMFNVSKVDLERKLKASKAVSWAEHPHSHGAYSYEMVGSKEVKKILRQPIAGTIYFAGEGLHDGAAPGTVEAALCSGKEVAQKLISSWQYNNA